MYLVVIMHYCSIFTVRLNIRASYAFLQRKGSQLHECIISMVCSSAMGSSVIRYLNQRSISNRVSVYAALKLKESRTPSSSEEIMRA